VPSTQPATTQAAQLPTSRPTAEVLALVNDLTSDEYAVRENAQQKIEKMGDEVVPQLRRILDGPLPDEARARIRAAIDHIDEARAFGPSVITLQCHDAPLRNVLEDFAKQADADLGVHRREIQDYLQSRKISLNLNHADFWTALEAIESASGLHARPDNDGRLILDSTGSFGQMGDRSLGCVAGPCLILPQSVNWSMQFGHSSMLYIQFLAVIEPKLHVVGSVQSAWLRECIDDKGHSLLVPLPRGGVFVGPRQWWVPFGANLRVVPGMGRKIARLKGEFDFSVQLKSEPIEVDDLLTAKNVTRSAAGGAITVERCSLENGQYQLHLLISAPPASGIMAFVANPFGSNLRVLDAKDQPLQLIGTSRSGNNDGRTALTLTYLANAGAVGPPKRLKWEVTTEARQLTVPFEFHDLDLLHAPDEGGQ
jgi:hypothetical protein